jgi:8-oxo-dGTP pyrophosphatase MutT (NUDIX family)
VTEHGDSLAATPEHRSPLQPTPAAVLLPFYRDPSGELRLILIERTRHGRHGGQIALPGGKYEAADTSLRVTAVRETCEELGLRPDDLEVVSELPPLRTRATGYQVWPFVARLRRVPDVWRPGEAEVASVLDVRVVELADTASRGVEEMEFAAWNGRERVPVRRIGGYTVWGLTLRILEPVLPRALAGEYPV